MSREKKTSLIICCRRVSLDLPGYRVAQPCDAGQQASAGELIANNAIHAGFISGKGGLTPSHFSETMFDGARLEIFLNNQLLGQCEGQFLLETIRYH